MIRAGLERGQPKSKKTAAFALHRIHARVSVSRGQHPYWESHSP